MKDYKKNYMILKIEKGVLVLCHICTFKTFKVKWCKWPFIQTFAPSILWWDDWRNIGQKSVCTNISEAF